MPGPASVARLYFSSINMARGQVPASATSVQSHISLAVLTLHDESYFISLFEGPRPGRPDNDATFGKICSRGDLYT